MNIYDWDMAQIDEPEELGLENDYDYRAETDVEEFIIERGE